MYFDNKFTAGAGPDGPAPAAFPLFAVLL